MGDHSSSQRHDPAPAVPEADPVGGAEIVEERVYAADFSEVGEGSQQPIERVTNRPVHQPGLERLAEGNAEGRLKERRLSKINRLFGDEDVAEAEQGDWVPGSDDITGGDPWWLRGGVAGQARIRRGHSGRGGVVSGNACAPADRVDF